MVIFYSYVSLPEGNIVNPLLWYFWCLSWVAPKSTSLCGMVFSTPPLWYCFEIACGLLSVLRDCPGYVYIIMNMNIIYIIIYIWCNIMLPQRGNKTYRLTVSLLYIPKAYAEYIIDISLFIRVCVCISLSILWYIFIHIRAIMYYHADYVKFTVYALTCHLVI